MMVVGDRLRMDDGGRVECWLGTRGGEIVK